MKRFSRPILALGAIAPKVRLDYAGIESLNGLDAQVRRHEGYAVSVVVNIYPSSEIVERNVYPYRNFFVSFEYHFLREITGPTLDNDRFVARITGRF